MHLATGKDYRLLGNLMKLHLHDLDFHMTHSRAKQSTGSLAQIVIIAAPVRWPVEHLISECRTHWDK